MTQVKLEPLGIHLTLQAQVSLLAALQRAKVDLPAVCSGQGTCGTCALRVVSGDHSLSPMQNLERSTLINTHQDPAHYRLLCQATIVSCDPEVAFYLETKAAKKLVEIFKRLENRIAPQTLCHPITGEEVVAAGQPITRSALERLLSYR
jgi:ferredoxin